MQSFTLAATLILTLSAGPDPATLTRPFTLAVVDSQGKLLPVARFDGRRWRNTWTLQLERHEALPFSKITEIPADWLGRAVPRSWGVLDSEGWNAVQVTGVTRWDGCVSPVVLTTTAHASEVNFRLAFDFPPAVELPEPGTADATLERVRAALPAFVTPDPSVQLRTLGILRVRKRAVWIVEVSGNGSAVAVVVDVSRAGIRQLAVGDTGGC